MTFLLRLYSHTINVAGRGRGAAAQATPPMPGSVINTMATAQPMTGPRPGFTGIPQQPGNLQGIRPGMAIGQGHMITGNIPTGFPGPMTGSTMTTPMQSPMGLAPGVDGQNQQDLMTMNVATPLPGIPNQPSQHDMVS